MEEAEVTDYRVEVRVDIQATDDEDARRQAFALAGKVDGEVTAIFNDEWDEV